MAITGRNPNWFWLIAIISVIFLCLYLFGHQVAFPNDEGQVALTALRIISGQLPHRDFLECYTGLLSYIHAGIVILFDDTDTFYFRLLPYTLSLTAYSCIYWALATIYSPPLSFFVTISIFSATTLVYLGPVPTPLFAPVALISTYLIWLCCLRRHIYLLFLCGFMGGLLLTIKITGVYTIIATVVALWIWHIMNFASIKSCPNNQDQNKYRMLCRYFESVLPLVILIITVVLCAYFLNFSYINLFIVLSPFTILLRLIFSVKLFPVAMHFRAALLKDITILILGAALPIITFVVWFSLHGSLDELLYGVFVIPRMRLTHTLVTPPDLHDCIVAGLLTALFLLLFRLINVDPISEKHPRIRTLHLACIMGITLLLLHDGNLIPLRFNEFCKIGIPLLCIAVSVRRLPWAIQDDSVLQNSPQISLITTFIVHGCFLWLSVFPFASNFYASILSAPLLFGLFSLLTFGTTMCWQHSLVLFGITSFFVMANVPIRTPDSYKYLDSRIARVMVPSKESGDYHQICEMIRANSQPREKVFAGPDCPALLYLCGRPPFDDLMYDFFEVAGTHNRISRLLADENTSVVVINKASEFSPQYPEAELRRIHEAFEFIGSIGTYDIYKREMYRSNR